ncbi:hypothetical protein J7E63_20120 [Bacillus sp. ISL-75]|uniref:hypothetical protein n=1 Tax=Bacillus sp. ISL-75 TaxID=2819137 RepID=UPI001BE5D5E4|nr:hypothetical protein [Bacillus sp. ISL-75]MBT2729206.1 hypothetical protein [Bacillus sp. ISL-75]
MKQAFFNELVKQDVKFTIEDKCKYFSDFKLYCEEMDFTTEEELVKGAFEYVTCQIHYGIFR